ncbi:MAG: family 78 glycoside hydrolase catalytic domain [Acidobacteria bacterium]|nr:family 78 glycoside hydrolase catalytic domain [Acidobacteriota bacterium]
MRSKKNHVVSVVVVALICSFAWLGQPALGASGAGRPVALKCEYLTDPVGIDVRQPRFAWVLENSERGQLQTAYQVLVATSTNLLEPGKADQWDSGKVASDNSAQVVFAGKPLESGRTYYWRVRTWDKSGQASPTSDTAQFEMAMLSPSDWKAQWIGGNNLLRKEFQIPGPIRRARAYVTALGYYELRLNGEKVGKNVLDPGWTTFEKRHLYTTYDITSHLRPGPNAVGVMLGNGWAVMDKRFGEPLMTPYSWPALLLQMEIETADGKRLTVASDGTWKTGSSPIVSNSIYDGEVYDARRESPFFDRSGYGDASWATAQVMKPTGGVLSAQMIPPIRVIDTLVPVKLMNPQPGVYVYDIGQNMSGWARLKVKGPEGTAVRMRFSELVYPNGMINRENIRGARAEDTYILRGEGTEIYEPRFTYHGFRYVEVTGFPGTPSLDSIRARLVHTDVEPTGSFVSSNPTLNAIQKITRWGLRTNLHSVQTDCDQRDERLGWMGDLQTTAETAMMNFDMAAFYTNTVRNIRDVQGADGTVTDTVPHKYGSRPADPAWGTAYPQLTWFLYEYYGDRRILEETYDGVKRYVEFLRTRAPDNVLRFSYYGDWVAIERTPNEYVSDYFYYNDVNILRKMAEVLGNAADRDAYAELGGKIKEAFNKEFLNTKSANYANGTQTANAMALYLDMVPEEKHERRGLKGAVQFNLTQDVVYQHDSHLTTGFIGAKILLPTLTKMGRSDLAYDVVTQTTYPSWGFMIANGATTLWELWNNKVGPSMNSHNHPMLGSVGAWLYQALGGINPDPAAPGYRRILIRPQIVRDLTSASTTVETVRGPVTSSWTHTPGRVTLEANIPVNSEAQIVIPKDDEMGDVVVREGSHIVWDNGAFVPGTPGVNSASEGAEGASFLAPAKKVISLEVGSGHYVFELTRK